MDRPRSWCFAVDSCGVSFFEFFQTLFMFLDYCSRRPANCINQSSRIIFTIDLAGFFRKSTVSVRSITYLVLSFLIWRPLNQQ
jgi:hypothetical protein